jgi:glycosyltransferase involved in cell wall biosynthesis
MVEKNPAPRRLAVVLSHPVQYYSPWFRELTLRPEITLRVFYLWNFGVSRQLDPQFGRELRWDIDLLGGYDHEFVPNVARRPGTESFGGLDNPALPERLAAWAPDALLFFGYAWKSHLRALWWARRNGTPTLLRGDSHLLGRPHPPWFRRVAMRLLLAQFRAFAAVGQANRDFYRAYAVPADRIFHAPHAVDAARFLAAEPEARPRAAALRAELGLGARRVVLFAGKFQERKQPAELLEAFTAVAGPAHALVYVGDGPERPRLAALAAAQPRHHIRFLPFANQTEMPSRYLLGDIFCLPSRGAHETWGLAVNEAMHLGRPCLVGDVVGCQRDLVSEGETGWVFASEDPASLRQALGRALGATDAELARLGAQARARAGHYTYAEATEGLLEAVRHATTRL